MQAGKTELAKNIRHTPKVATSSAAKRASHYFPSLWESLAAWVLIVLAPTSSLLLVYHSIFPNHEVDFFTAWLPTASALKVLGVFWATIIVLYFLPGKEACGPIAPSGHVPKYTDNGVLHMILFVGLFVAGGYFSFPGADAPLYKLSVLYDEMLPMVSILNAGGITFALYLYVKGRTHPSTADVTYSGRGFFYDYYAGIELYPKVFGLCVKKIVNCRFSMTFWMVFGISATVASYNLHGELDYGLMWCSILTFLYLVTFFLWEIGYMRSIDIIEDNAGFMETWGCLVFVPCIYTNHMACAVQIPSQLSWEVSTAIGIIGIACVWIVYWINRQRQVFRETGGKSMLWWPTKPEALQVNYTVTLPDGRKEAKKSILLVNGFWGWVRHPQYIFELGVALSWGLLTNPTLRYGQSLIYFIVLTVLLFHRAVRDTRKCKHKYGAGFDEYSRRVPYMIIPGIF